MAPEQTTETGTQDFDLPQQINYEEAIEAILFAAGHPITYDQLAKVFEIPVSELKSIVYDYAKKYNDDHLSRGVTLITFDSCCQLCTKPEYISCIRAALGIRKSSGTLSASTIEALTIVAYQQPVTRAYVDAVRNTDTSYAMTNLLDRGLIEAKGRKDVPGRPILYGTTNAFLRCFGLNSLDDLPGSTGEAQSVFRSINNRLKLDDKVSGEQISIDEIMSGQMPSIPDTKTVNHSDAALDNTLRNDGETAVTPDEDIEEDFGGAAEEAERLQSAD